MSHYEYKLVPMPAKSRIWASADPEAMNLSEAVNALAGEGWNFVRTDRLPYPNSGIFRLKRSGLRDVLVFQRTKDASERLGFGTGRKPASSVQDFVADAENMLQGLKPLSQLHA